MAAVCKFKSCNISMVFIPTNLLYFLLLKAN